MTDPKTTGWITTLKADLLMALPKNECLDYLRFKREEFLKLNPDMIGKIGDVEEIYAWMLFLYKYLPHEVEK